MREIRYAKAAFVLLCALLWSGTALGQATYSLKKVTSVHADGLYVFEQDGYVMNNAISSGSLTTTNSFLREGLTGGESYVWQLKKYSSKKTFRMRNVSLYDISEPSQLYNPSGNNLDFATTSSGIYWTFDFQSDGTAIIRDLNRDYYLGYTSTTSHIYKYYEYASNHELMQKEPYSITVYELVESDKASVTTSGYATNVADVALDFTSVENLKAYKAQVDGNSVNFTRVYKVPAGQGVLLRAMETLESTKTYTIPVCLESVSWDDNDFVRGTGATVSSNDGEYYNYILNNVGGEIGFYHANGQTVAANRCYLRTTTKALGRMSMVFDDEMGETTIMEAVAKPAFPDTSDMYNLQGQRVSEPRKGLYILKGKKIVY